MFELGRGRALFLFIDKLNWYPYATAIKLKKTRGIDHPCWDMFVGNFDALANGYDEDGQPVYIDEFGQVWGAILLFSEADLEQDTVGWGLPSYNAADECCGWCLANRSSRPLTDMSADATWRPTENMTNEVNFDVLCSGLNHKCVRLMI